MCANRISTSDVTRDDLGKLGGNPNFTPPPYDRQSQAEQGIVTDATIRSFAKIEGWGKPKEKQR